jgi:N utilization substance protein A
MANQKGIKVRDEDDELVSESAGQSGDTQGLSDEEESNSESVKELLEEGQYYEASVVSGLENVPPADEAEVTTKQVPEDDVPGEYLDEVEYRK